VIRSSLCPGILTHRRLDHPRHGFSYSLYMLLLDLDELPEIDRRSRLFGHNRPRPIGFHDRDHLDEDARPVRLKVEDLLRRQGIDPPGGRILLLTHARVLGHVFNPVSFYYCYDAKGRLGARVAEVNNTFGDRHCYADASPAWRDKKVMHVSPFFSMSGSYRFDLPEPAPSRIVARVDLTREERPVLEARLTLRPRPLTDRALAGALVRYPFMTLKVVAAIHFEALRLWGKGARVFENPSYHPEAARKEVA
jgi:DUF1365 family protein